jgi:spore germination protein KA
MYEIPQLKKKNGKKDTEAHTDKTDKSDKTGKTNKTDDKIPKFVQDVRERLLEVFSECSDFVLRDIAYGDSRISILIGYIDGLIDKQILNQHTIEPLTTAIMEGNDFHVQSIIGIIKDRIVNNSELSETDSFKNVIQSLLSGYAVLFVDDESTALKIGLKSAKGRAVGETDSERSLRGPREGFVENLQVNITLLRQTIKNPNLKIENMILGEQTHTDISLCYIKNIANDKIVKEVKARLAKIKIDAIMESGYIEQFIEDNAIRFFPMVGNSEKPDKVAAKLLEGRVAILCDGTPFVLTVPFLFIENFQVAEDYYGNPIYSSILRIFRLASLLITTCLPALYVALAAFHQTVIPFKLLLTMAASREGIPFTPYVEALLMNFCFDLLREAGIRMPKAIGDAVSIVGAIVLGQAAVEAGIASAPMVIVTSLTAICSFIVPSLAQVSMIMRYIFLTVANLFGLFGIAIVFVMMFSYLCTKRSFGVPYLSPFAPLNTQDLKDTFIVVPVWAMFTRPKSLAWSQSDIEASRVTKRTSEGEGNENKKEKDRKKY